MYMYEQRNRLESIKAVFLHKRRFSNLYKGVNKKVHILNRKYTFQQSF